MHNVEIVKRQNNIISNKKLINSIIDILPAHVYIKDVDGYYLFCNKQQATSLGLKISDIIGKTDYDLSEKKRADIFRKNDLEVINSKKKLITEEIAVYNNKEESLLSTKAPLIDDNNKVIGVIGVSINITAEKEAAKLKIEHKKYEAYDHMYRSLEAEIIKCLNINVPEKTEIEKNLKLTLRQTQVLYLLSHKKSPKSIANYLSEKLNKDINHEAINAMINKQLYPKFDVSSTERLIEKALLLKLIPLIFPEKQTKT